MAKKHDLRSKLFDCLDLILEKDGFKLERTLEWYTRKSGDITHVYKLDFYTSSRGSRIQPAICVRSDALHRIFHMISGIKPPDQKYHTAVSVAVWRLYGTRDGYEFLLSSESDLQSVTDSLGDVFHRVAMPFFEKCSSIEYIDNLYNSDPNSPSTRVYLLEAFGRSSYATIAARLAGNPKYLELVETYRSFLASYQDGRHSKRYDELVALLETESAAGES